MKTNIKTQKLRELFGDYALLFPEDEGFSAYNSDVAMCLDPDVVLRPATEEAVLDIVEKCISNGIPFTPSGARTSVTGASVCSEGVLLCTEKLRTISPPFSSDFGTIINSGPGVLLADLKREAERHNFFYPPDPTSWEEATVGGTVATNATGEDSYFYGTTRNYVCGLRFIDGTGRIHNLQRQSSPQQRPHTKNRAGYELDGDDTDLLTGSEGTLGIILESSLLLHPLPKPFVGAFFFFQTELSALDFVLALHENRSSLSLISVEYMDAAAAGLMANYSTGFVVPDGSFCIYIKAESQHDEFIYDWIPILEKFYAETAVGENLADYAVAGQTAAEILAFRRLRHYVPASINEQAQILMAVGGGKISSDWWVPLDKLQAQMAFLREGLSSFSCPVYVFGHIGNGHPHINFLPGNAAEKQHCFEFTCECMRQAAAVGGGVCGEHGLGKLKTVALEIQWTAEKISLMRSVKRRFDPAGLASPGNIFNHF